MLEFMEYGVIFLSAYLLINLYGLYGFEMANVHLIALTVTALFSIIMQCVVMSHEATILIFILFCVEFCIVMIYAV